MGARRKYYTTLDVCGGVDVACVKKKLGVEVTFTHDVLGDYRFLSMRLDGTVVKNNGFYSQEVMYFRNFVLMNAAAIEAGVNR